jgi:hypothetical protein
MDHPRDLNLADRRARACRVVRVALGLLLGVPAHASALERCGTTEPELRMATAAAAIATDPVVEARVVFVSFPDHPRQNLPAWREAFCLEFDEYIRTMSGGRQRVNLRVLERPGAADRAWIAARPAAFYRDTSSWGALNEEIMTAIATAIPGAWTGVEQVFVMHYRHVFSNPGWVGIASLGCDSCAPGFTGLGTTQRFPEDWVDEPINAESNKWVAAHEYGHMLGFRHTPPGLGAGPGRYDVMRALASFVQEDGFVPYHALHLADPKVAWLPPRRILTTDMEGLRVPDIRGPQPAFFEVRVPSSSNQSFLLVNHQAASSPYDAKYRGSGLYIWHLLDDRNQAEPDAIDLEIAEGEFVPLGAGLCQALDFGQPDPVAGMDRLEACNSQRGGELDVFDGVVRSHFTAVTNPSTNLYDSFDFRSPQSLPTSVAFENIRRDPATGDMVVDVYVAPTQKLLVPNGGERLEVVDIQWRPRDLAGITDVDILVSRNSGASFQPLALGEANDGAHRWQPDATERGDRYRIRIVSRDRAGGVGIDDSDADFSVNSDAPGGCGASSPCGIAMDPQPNPRASGGPLRLAFCTPCPDRVKVEIFDIRGRRVAGRAPAWVPGGRWETLQWDPGALPVGMYLLRLVTERGASATTKLAVVG